jgi:DNA-binding response OmpR family regulator
MSHRRQILVVDDDQDVLAAVKDVLEDEGFAVATARNGMVALGAIDGGLRPGLIILDFMMPVMDGLTFRREQLARGDVAHVPVLGMTAHPHMTPVPGDQFDVMIKPVGARDLIDRVRALLGDVVVVPPSEDKAFAVARRRARFWRRVKILTPIILALAGLIRALAGR